MPFNNHSKHHSVLASMVSAVALLMVIPTAAQVGLGLLTAMAAVIPGSVKPGTVSFLATNPGSSFAGSPSSKVTWQTTRLSNGGNPFQVTVSAPPSFTGCNNPSSAIKVTCVSVTTNNSNNGCDNGASSKLSTISCSCTGGCSLSATPVIVTGVNARGNCNNNTTSYTVNLQYTLADS